MNISIFGAFIRILLWSKFNKLLPPIFRSIMPILNKGMFLLLWNLQYEFCCNNHRKTRGVYFHFVGCAWMFLREDGLYKYINISYNLFYVYLKHEKWKLTLNSALTTALKWCCNKLFINFFKNLLLISTGGCLSYKSHINIIEPVKLQKVCCLW